MKKCKKILAGILAFVLVVSGVYFGETEESKVLAADTTAIVENHDYIAVAYEQVNCDTEIPTIQSSEYQDWLFAGWFTGEGCSKESALAETDEPDENCYAKFLPKEVLDVKVQTMNAPVQEGEINAPNGAMRFVSSVDSLDYQYAGFHITYPDGTTKEHEVHKALEKIDSNVRNADTNEKFTYEFSPKIIDTQSEYFITAKLAVESKDADYVVKAFYKTLDGTTVYGESRRVSVNDGKADTALSLSFKNTSETPLKEGDSIDVSYGNGGTGTANVVGTDGQTVHVRITLDNATKGDLPSATKFVFEEYGSTIYRNLYTKYDGKNADRTWYDVYSVEGNTEFIIATAADFYGMASIVNDGERLEGKTVYLAADIDANADDAMDWSTGTINQGKTVHQWTPIGTLDNYFKGCFNGDGHVISGIYLDTDETTYANGMFGYVVDAVIKNFELQNSHYTGSGYVSTIAGEGDGTLAHIKCANSVYINSTSFIVGGVFCYIRDRKTTNGNAGTNCYINDCWFDGNITVNYTGAQNVRIGSMVAFKTIGYVVINNALFTGDIDVCLRSTDNINVRSTMVGGIFGTQNDDANGNITLKDCISVGAIKSEAIQQGTKAVSVKAGVVYGGGTCPQSYTNVYGVTDDQCAQALGYVNEIPSGITLYDSISKLNGKNGKDMGFEKIHYWESDSADVPTLKYFKNKTAIAEENDFEWIYESAGDERDSYMISNIKELVVLEKLINDYGWTFEGNFVTLANSITANKGVIDRDFVDNTATKEKTWIPIGTRSGLTANDGNSFKGNFDGAGYAISGLYVNSDTLYAGLFGYTQDCTIQNLRLLNSYFKTSKECLGSVSGGGDGRFKNIYSEVDLYSSSYFVGGIIGRVSDTADKRTTETLVEECWYNGDITQNYSDRFFTGGIMGYVIQGFVANDGIYQNIMRNCLYTGNILCQYTGTNASVQNRVGGLCGGNNAGTEAEFLIEKSMSAGTITIKGSNGVHVGSIMGRAGGNGDASATQNVTMCVETYAVTTYNLAVAGDGIIWDSAKNIDFSNNTVLAHSWNTLNGSEGNIWTLNIDAEEEKYKLILSEFCADIGLQQPKMAWVNYDAKMSYENGTEGLAIYLPTEKGYINYNFVHTVTSNANRADGKANSDMWRLSVVNLCDDNGNIIKRITNYGAEWEMAIRLAGRNDFIGGYAHGDEKIVANTMPTLIMDGVEQDITSVKNKQFSNMILEMDSEGFDPNNGTDKLLEHHKKYTITKEGILLEQTVSWCNEEPLKLDSSLASYLAMMPPMKYSSTDTTDIITDSYYTDVNKEPLKITINNFKIRHDNVNTLCVFGEDSGIYFTMTKSNYSPECNNGKQMLLSDNSGQNYNKMYFIFAQNEEISSGDVWRATTTYKIEWK